MTSSWTAAGGHGGDEAHRGDMEPYGERIIRAAVNVMHSHGQDGRDWLGRAVLVATGKLDHTHLDPGGAPDPPPSGYPRSPAVDG